MSEPAAPSSVTAAPRERVLAALEYRAPDVVPVEYHASPSGFHEHGQKLGDLWLRHPDDFGPPGRFPLACPPPGSVDASGQYREIKTDEWGVRRDSRVFGAGGIPVECPLAGWPRLESFKPPPIPPASGPAFAAERERAARHRSRYFLKSGWVSLFELMHALRGFEDALADIANGEPEIHRLADMLTEYHADWIRYALARGVDAIQFGDDFGSQSGLLLSPPMWRGFFRQRYEHLIRLAHEGGAKVLFHSCGCVRGLLNDLADLGVDAIWPQLNTYALDDLARRCRDRRLAVALHPDRGELMIRSTAAAVREYVLRLAETFKAGQGGSWFYVEVDSGFPFENVAALTEAIAQLRGN